MSYQYTYRECPFPLNSLQKGLEEEGEGEGFLCVHQKVSRIQKNHSSASQDSLPQVSKDNTFCTNDSSSNYYDRLQVSYLSEVFLHSRESLRQFHATMEDLPRIQIVLFEN